MMMTMMTFTYEFSGLEFDEKMIILHLRSAGVRLQSLYVLWSTDRFLRTVVRMDASFLRSVTVEITTRPSFCSSSSRLTHSL